MTTLAIYSNKGGVGKTAAAVNLSYLAAQTGAKTLLMRSGSTKFRNLLFSGKTQTKVRGKGIHQRRQASI